MRNLDRSWIFFENEILLVFIYKKVRNFPSLLARCSREIFESSEVGEKRQLLNLVFQNLQLRGVNLSVSVQEPFLTMLDCKDHPTNWRWRDSNSRAKRTSHPWLHAYRLLSWSDHAGRRPTIDHRSFENLDTLCSKEKQRITPGCMTIAPKLLVGRWAIGTYERLSCKKFLVNFFAN